MSQPAVCLSIATDIRQASSENPTLSAGAWVAFPAPAGSGAARHHPQSARQGYTVGSIMLLKVGDKSGADGIASFRFRTRQCARHVTDHHCQPRGFHWFSRCGEAHDEIEWGQQNIAIARVLKEAT